jgi:hypothetical protein
MGCARQLALRFPRVGLADRAGLLNILIGLGHGGICPESGDLIVLFALS